MKITEEEMEDFCCSLPDPENLEKTAEKFIKSMEAVQKRFAGQKVTIKGVVDFLIDDEE